jgi:hypothetical protein
MAGQFGREKNGGKITNPIKFHYMKAYLKFPTENKYSCYQLTGINRVLNSLKSPRQRSSL